jgi:ParB-like nuclease domain
VPATWVETREVPITDLTRYPGNARRGNVDEIRSSIRRHGQYRAIVVRDTDDGLVILAGNHTFDAIAAEGHQAARCEIINCSDDEARRINLADNKLAELGSYDTDALVELLSYLDGDYEGVGWTDDEVQAMITPGDDDGESAGNGELLQLAGVTVGDPRHTVEPGQVWKLGPHHLVIADLFTEWQTWAPLLDGDVTFMPYPTPLVPHAPDIGPLVMVQPVPYLAGHLLDKWQNITGQEPVVVNGRLS